MRYEGTIEASISREEFYSLMTDPVKLIGFIPDVVESSVADRDHFSVKARVGAGPARGILDVSFETVEKKPGTGTTLRGRGRGMQSTVDLTLRVVIEDAPKGSRAAWTAEASVGGLLASLGGRLVEGLASKYVNQITENMRREVEA